MNNNTNVGQNTNNHQVQGQQSGLDQFLNGAKNVLANAAYYALLGAALTIGTVAGAYAANKLFGSTEKCGDHKHVR